MKTLFPFFFIFFLGVVFPTCTRSPSSGGEQETKQIEEKTPEDPLVGIIARLNKMVNLSPEQIDSIQALGSGFDFDGPDRKTMRQKRKEFQRKVTEEVLSEEQRNELRRLMNERKKEGQ